MYGFAWLVSSLAQFRTLLLCYRCDGAGRRGAARGGALLQPASLRPAARPGSATRLARLSLPISSLMSTSSTRFSFHLAARPRHPHEQTFNPPPFFPIFAAYSVLKVNKLFLSLTSVPLSPNLKFLNSKCIHVKHIH